MYFPTHTPETAEKDAEGWEPARILDRWNSWALVYFPNQDLTTWIDLGTEPYQPLSSAEAAWRLDELGRVN